MVSLVRCSLLLSKLEAANLAVLSRLGTTKGAVSLTGPGVGEDLQTAATNGVQFLTSDDSTMAAPHYRCSQRVRAAAGGMCGRAVRRNVLAHRIRRH